MAGKNTEDQRTQEKEDVVGVMPASSQRSVEMAEVVKKTIEKMCAIEEKGNLKEWLKERLKGNDLILPSPQDASRGYHVAQIYDVLSQDMQSALQRASSELLTECIPCEGAVPDEDQEMLAELLHFQGEMWFRYQVQPDGMSQCVLRLVQSPHFKTMSARLRQSALQAILGFDIPMSNDFWLQEDDINVSGRLSSLTFAGLLRNDAQAAFDYLISDKFETSLNTNSQLPFAIYATLCSEMAVNAASPIFAHIREGWDRLPLKLGIKLFTLVFPQKVEAKPAVQ